MIRKIAMLAALAMIGTSLAACGPTEPEPEYVAVCVDPNTEERLPDDYCDSNDDDYLSYALFWYMLASSNHAYPAVGSHVDRSHFRTTLPKGKTYTKGLSSSGGTSVKSWTTKTYQKKSSGSGWGSSGSSGSKSGGFSSGSRSSGRR